MAVLMLVCLLGATILVSASEDDWSDDDCLDCKDNGSDAQSFQKLYCKVLDIRESDLYNKVMLKIETRTNSRSDPGYVTFFNTSDYSLNRLHDWSDNKYSRGYWVNIFYTVNETGVCHILLVEKADMSSQDIALPLSLLLLFLFAIVFLTLLIAVVVFT